MTSTTHEAQVAGLHFKFSRLRARRGLRALSSLIALLGASAVSIITGRGANGITTSMIIEAAKKDGDPTGLTDLGKALVKTAIMGGNLSDPDTVERVADELLMFSDGQGVQISPDSGKSWIPLRGVSSLDAWESIGWLEMMQLLQLVIEFEFFPTSAGSHTNAGTAPADATTAKASGQGGPNNGPPTSGLTGVVAG